MKKIIYIMGAGRSGTTMMDVILGNAKDVFSCGELTRYPQKGGIPHNCGEDSRSFRFWAAFRKAFDDELEGDLSFERLMSLYRKFDHHDGFARNYFGLHKGDACREYKTYLVKFFRTLFDLSKKDILVDSSKYPNRALTLSRMVPYELNYLYIVRSPAAVVKSFGKVDLEQPSKDWLSANTYFFAANASCFMVKKMLEGRHPFACIKYEDLLARPVVVLKQLESVFKIDLGRPIELIEKRQPLTPGCLFDGNRLRLKKEVILRNKREETEPMTLKDRLSLVVNSLWW